ncbi:MAG: hypothetical protein ACLQGP_12935 [Isosphaeraceae bacterium]
MPLRDHFRPPLTNRRSWDWLHGGWPMTIAAGLNRQLPERYVAGPQVHLGSIEYEVCIYDNEANQRLVAAIELVSPADKDRPEPRGDFIARCASMLRSRVCVTIIDVVTNRTANLYGELMALLGKPDPALADGPLYAATCRWIKSDDHRLLETWAHRLALDEPLPTLPLWLADNLAVPLELEASYEETCQSLRLR